jgi:DNA-binding response OmpR family regulator
VDESGTDALLLLSPDPYVFEQIRLALSGTGWRLLKAASPSETSALLLTAQPEISCLIAPLDVLQELPALQVPVLAVGPAALVEFADPSLFDDLLVDPWTPQELRYRVRQLIRQSRCPFPGGWLSITAQTIHANSADGDLNSFTLTHAESLILRLLCRARGAPVPRDTLAQLLGVAATSRSVDMRISRLRKKLADATASWAHPVRIVSDHAGGYSLQG